VATIEEAFSLALQYHQAGHLPQAEQLYSQILQFSPNHADTLHLMGVLEYQRGRHDQAVASIRHALALNPSASAYYCNLGLVYQAQEKTADAIAVYQQVLRLQPQSAEAHCVLGNLLRLVGQRDEAISHCRQALSIHPGFAGAHNNLALALADQDKLDEAVEHYKLAVRFDPNYAAAYNNLGTALARQGKFAEAVLNYQHSLKHNRNFPEAYNGMGMALERLDRLDEAVSCYEQALQLKPNFPAACNNLGIARMKQGRSEEAGDCFRQALKLKPDHVDGFNNLATVLMSQGRLDEAVDNYRQALRVNPRYAEGYSNLASVLQSQNKLDESVDCFKEAIRLKPDFAQAHNNLAGVYLRLGRLDEALENFHQAMRLSPEMAPVRSSLLFCMNYDPHADPDDVFAEHRAWGREHTPSIPAPPHHNVRDPDRRLRIGYISPDLRFHPLTRYLEPVLAHHDPEKVEVFCYAEGPFTDAVTTRLQKLAHVWRWTSRQADAQIVDTVRNDKIDILVDLAGHTANNRLFVFAHKPAPIQVTWLGYMNTTGLAAMDYRLTDDVLDPADSGQLPVVGQRTTDTNQLIRDTEELWRLPGGMCCFLPPDDAPEVSPLPAQRRGNLTFGSLHGLLKLNARVFDLWAQVLQAVPTARLLMFHDTVMGTAQDRIRREFANRGIDSARLDLRQGSCKAGYLGIYEEIDVSLDAFPWTGGVTTCESLWMGVPMLTLCGVRPASRNSAALLARVGLRDWAADTPEEVVAMALRQAGELDRLGELRSQLRDRMRASLCDGQRFTRELEEAYRAMWHRWCEQRGRK
jgi:protein O-GlcNAc transferase